MARNGLEERVKTESRYYSDTLRRAYAKAYAKGYAESVLKVLERRGVSVAEEQRARVLECTDLELLEAWLDRAFDVTSAEELFA